MMMYNVIMPKIVNYQRLDHWPELLAEFGEINISTVGTGVLESKRKPI
jgi:hypothetical protein